MQYDCPMAKTTRDWQIATTRRELLSVAAVGGMGMLAAHTLEAWQGAARSSKIKFPKGAVIRTITKDVPPSALASGVTLFHEHLSIDIPPARPPAPGTTRQPPVTSNIDLIVEQVKAAQKDGIICMVDGGHADMGRNLADVAVIAKRTGMHVVASGGYYMQRTYPADLATKNEDEIAENLAKEARENRYGAFGEIGENANAPMSEEEKKIFRAVGKAHVRTNIPIFTHNAYGTGPNVPKDAGLRQLDLLEPVGVHPEHVAIGHTCCLDDPQAEVIKGIAKRGAWVGFDRMNRNEEFVSDEKRVKMLLLLLEAGFANRLLLSSDFTGSRTMEGPLYGRTKTVFAPKLAQAGVRPDVLHGILYDNPRRFLAFVPKKS